MNSKTIGILIAATLLVAVLAALTLKSSSQSVAPAGAPVELIAGFGDKINSVARLELSKGKDSLVVVRTGSGKDAAWAIESRANYPAKYEKVKELLVAINEIKLLDKKTDHPDRFAALEIEDPSPTAKSASVTLKDEKNAVLASFIVGKMAQGPGGRSGEGAFIRKAGENQVWQSTMKSMVDTNLVSWVDPVVMQIERPRIRAVTATPAAGEAIRISKSRSEDANFTLENKPAGKELKYPGAADAPSFAMEYLDMTDVAPIASVDFAKEPLGVTSCTTFDGLVATATLCRFENKVWVKLAFATDFTNVPDAPKTDEKKDDAKEPAKPAKSHDDVLREAEALSTRHARWAYQVVDYKSGQFLPKLAEMLKDPEPPQPAGPAGPPAPQGLPPGFPPPPPK